MGSIFTSFGRHLRRIYSQLLFKPNFNGRFIHFAVEFEWNEKDSETQHFCGHFQKQKKNFSISLVSFKLWGIRPNWIWSYLCTNYHVLFNLLPFTFYLSPLFLLHHYHYLLDIPSEYFIVSFHLSNRAVKLFSIITIWKWTITLWHQSAFIRS